MNFVIQMLTSISVKIKERMVISVAVINVIFCFEKRTTTAPFRIPFENLHKLF